MKYINLELSNLIERFERTMVQACISIKEMCKCAGIRGHKTNHGLCATGATQLYLAGVPEKTIQQRTGNTGLRHCADTRIRVSNKAKQ